MEATFPIRIKSAVIGILVVAAIEIAAAGWVSAGPFPRLGAVGCLRLIEIVILIGMFHRFEEGLAAIGLSRDRIRRGVGIGIGWAAGFGAVAAVAGLILHGLGLAPLRLIRVPLPASAYDRWLLFGVGGVISPIAEEIVFRGILYGVIRPLGRWAATILSTAAFALAHVSPGVPILPIIGGLVFALSYEHGESLVSPIIVHVFGNLAIFFLALVF